MKLCVPAIHKGRTFVEAELDKPRGGVIADAHEEIERTGSFGAMLKLAVGCLRSLTTDTGDVLTKRSEFEGVVRHMPIQTVEHVALRALSLVNDQGVDQIATCPRCADKRIYEDDEAIRFDDIEVVEFDGEQRIRIDLDDPVEIKSKGEVLVSVSSVLMRFPTLNDGISGSMQYPESRDIRRQYAIYASAIQGINGDEVDQKFRSQWGTWLFERMYSTDIEQVSEVMAGLGMKKTMARECRRCGKKWKEPINIAGFFASGLRA